MINRDLNRLNEEWSPGRAEPAATSRESYAVLRAKWMADIAEMDRFYGVVPAPPAAEPGEEWTVMGCDSFDGIIYEVGRYPTFDGAMDVVRAKTAEHEKSQPGGMPDRFSAHRTRKAIGTAKVSEPGEMSRGELERLVGDISTLGPDVPYVIAQALRSVLATDAALRSRAERERQRADAYVSECNERADKLIAMHSATVRRAERAEAEVKRLNEKFSRTWDDPTTDGTDGAHPAWWRGQDHGSRKTVEVIAKAFDEPLPITDGYGEGIESVRQRVAALRQRCERLERTGAKLRSRLSWHEFSRADMAEWDAAVRGEVKP